MRRGDGGCCATRLSSTTGTASNDRSGPVYGLSAAARLSESRFSESGCSTKSVLARERLTHDERVYLVCAFVREHRLEIVDMPDHRIFERDPVAAEDRARATRDLDRAADV